MVFCKAWFFSYLSIFIMAVLMFLWSLISGSSHGQFLLPASFFPYGWHCPLPLNVVTFCWKCTFKIVYCSRFGYRFLTVLRVWGCLFIWLLSSLAGPFSKGESKVYFPCSVQPLMLLFREHALGRAYINAMFIMILTELFFTDCSLDLSVNRSATVGLQILLTDFSVAFDNVLGYKLFDIWSNHIWVSF